MADQKLTIDDPVSPEILSDFNKLENARYHIATQLLDLEQERVKLLAAAHRVDEQKQRTFERILVERGLAPSTQFEVDSTNGKLKLLDTKPVKPAA